MITETEWSSFESPVCDDCTQNECMGQAQNPLATVSTLCVCGHSEGAHWKGKACRMYACCCGKFVRDES